MSRDFSLRFERIVNGPDGFTTEPLADELEALRLPAGTLVLVVRTPDRKDWKPRASVRRVATDAGSAFLAHVDAWTYRWPDQRAGVQKSIDAWLRGTPRLAGDARKKINRPGPVVSRVTPMLLREPSAVEVESMTSPAQIAKACADMVGRDREVFRVMHFDSRSKLVSYEDVSVGTMNASLVHPREVFRGAILAGAAHVILVHNHPSGDPSPSGEDRAVTKRLADIGKLRGIQVVDHVIVGDRGRYRSLAESMEMGL